MDEPTVLKFDPPPAKSILKDQPAVKLVAETQATMGEFSQDEVAEKFSDTYADEFRYVAANDQWMQWTGTFWKAENTCLVFDNIRKISREFCNVMDRSDVKAANIAGAERLAKSDRRHAATPEQFDTDPWILNTPGSIIDLKTGEPRPNDPSAMCSRITSVGPANIPTPKYDAFMERVQPNAEVRDYIHRRCGYALTGLVGEAAIFFDYGTGANGKSVWQRILIDILGTYAITAPMNLVTESDYERHSQELARLHKARVVAMEETEEGSKWNEQRLKQFTGGLPITARFMRQNDFTFTPEFALFISGNHMPKLSGVDESIRRRFQIVGWEVTIPKNERVRMELFVDSIRPEFPGILNKYIQACLDWQNQGLNPPPLVTSKTDQYFESEDHLTLWLNNCTSAEQTTLGDKIILPRCDNATAFASWCAFCESEGILPGKKSKFLEQLRSQVRSVRGDSGNLFAIRVTNISTTKTIDSQPEKDEEII